VQKIIGHLSRGCFIIASGVDVCREFTFVLKNRLNLKQSELRVLQLSTSGKSPSQFRVGCLSTSLLKSRICFGTEQFVSQKLMK
jgi:hypothetical protein